MQTSIVEVFTVGIRISDQMPPQQFAAAARTRQPVTSGTRTAIQQFGISRGGR